MTGDRLICARMTPHNFQDKARHCLLVIICCLSFPVSLPSVQPIAIALCNSTVSNTPNQIKRNQPMISQQGKCIERQTKASRLKTKLGRKVLLVQLNRALLNEWEKDE